MGNTAYTTPEKVAALMGLAYDYFGASSTPTKATVETIIRQSERIIEGYTEKSFREMSFKEYLDNSDLYTYDWFYRIHLKYRRIRPLSHSAGDILNVWNGNSYDDFVQTKTEGRANDFYLDYDEGMLYIKQTLFYGDNAVQFTYRYNYGASTTADGAIGLNDTTITVISTSGFPQYGTVTIDNEDILYAGITTTTLRNCVRGVNNTTAATHLTNSPITYIPEDITEACGMLAATNLIEGDDRSAFIPDSKDRTTLEDKANYYKERAYKILERYKGMRLITYQLR